MDTLHIYNFQFYIAFELIILVYVDILKLICFCSGVQIREEPLEMPTTGADGIFSYENLPPKHWKKYVYASRFVNLVKAKTPKVTLYSQQAKCQLMESLKDFEVSFYKGSKIIMSAAGGVKVLDQSGRDVTQEPTIAQYKLLMDHYEECLKHCKSLCSSVELLQANGNCFPIIVGRRPSFQANQIKTQTTNSVRNITNLMYSTPKSQQVNN